MTNKAQELIGKIETLENTEVSEKSMQGRYHIHVEGDGQKLFTAHANNGEQIRSVMARAAQHIRDGGMKKIKAKVHDTVANKDYSHRSVDAPDGSIRFDGADPRSYAV